MSLPLSPAIAPLTYLVSGMKQFEGLSFPPQLVRAGVLGPGCTFEAYAWRFAFKWSGTLGESDF